MLTYYAIIPARNESERLASTIQALRSRPEVAGIIVIDDASTDDTYAVATRENATRIVRLEKRAGKGGALMAGMKAAPDNAEAYLFLDADLGDSATECVKLIAPLENNTADMTMGLLPPDLTLSAAGASGGGLGLVVGLARRGLLRRTGIEFLQPLAGQRAIRRSMIDPLGSALARGFGVEVGLTLAAVRAGCRVMEVETMFRHRVTGKSARAYLHRARQLIDVAAALRG